jgi:hypothetical protein
MIMMDEANVPHREIIRKAFLDSPVPDKYNDHNTAERVFDPDTIKLTEADKAAYLQATAPDSAEITAGKAVKKKGGFGKIMKGVAGAALSVAAGTESSTTIDAGDREVYATIAYKHLLEKSVAKQLFDKWFINDRGDFTMDLVKERGLYDATVMDVQTAKSSVRGMGMLADAGEELVNNTFVVVSRYRYMSKEELVAELEAAAKAVGSLFGAYGDLAASAGGVARLSLGEGYYVRTTSFLFQLRWNDHVSNTFYADLWNSPEKYHASDIFALKYIGEERAWANTKAGIFTSKTEEELIRIATVNATDAVLAKLEKKYDVFKTKTPLLSVEPLTASIGLKEGLEPGDKYEVLEKSINAETGKTEYKRKATVTVTKNKEQIWDNRYMASEEQALSGDVQPITATRFEGPKDLYPGMLLRQIK